MTQKQSLVIIYGCVDCEQMCVIEPMKAYSIFMWIVLNVDFILDSL